MVAERSDSSTSPQSPCRCRLMAAFISTRGSVSLALRVIISLPGLNRGFTAITLIKNPPLRQRLEAVGRQDVEYHFVGNRLVELGAVIPALGVEPFLHLVPGHLHHPALDDMGRIALDEPVDHAGAADQPDLADGQGQRRALHPAVQLAAGHHPLEAV